MKRDVKIQFSPKELRYMNDTDFLLHKRLITEKLYILLSELRDVLKDSSAHNDFQFPVGTDIQTGKISRGENLKGLPYIILDFPRLFKEDDIFAFRTIFWWGHYFSFTLHLKGKPLIQHQDTLRKNLKKLIHYNIHFYSGDDEWEHDLEVPCYETLKTATSLNLNERRFMKLSTSIVINEYSQLLKQGRETYERFLRILAG